MSKYGNDWKPEIGQKVVILVDGYRTEKGTVAKVIDVKLHCCVHLVLLDRCEVLMPCDYKLACRVHGKVLMLKKGDPIYMESCCVAPVEDKYTGNAISEILEKFAPCEGGKVDKKVKELEPQTM